MQINILILSLPITYPIILLSVNSLLLFHILYMRYLAFLWAFLLSVCAFAQPSQPHSNTNGDKYFSLDTNTYLINNPFANIKDTLDKLRKDAARAGDNELILTLKLFTYIKEYQSGHIVSNDTSEYHLSKIIVEANEKKIKRLEANATQALGDFYSHSQQLSAAIEQYICAYSIYRNFNFTEFPEKQAYTYKIGLAFYKYQDYEQSITYLREALHLKQSTQYSLYASIANTLGLAYRNMKMYDSAVVYFQDVYDTATKRNEAVWTGISIGNIGITYYLQKKYVEAEPLLKKDIEISLANSSIKNAVGSMITLATIYCEQNKYSEAEKLLLKALNICHEKSFLSDFSLAAGLYKQLYKLYGLKKDYRLSYLYADSALLAKDSAASRHNALTLSMSYEKQDFIKKKLAAEKLQNQTKLNKLDLDKKQIVQQQLLYKFIIGLLIVLFLVAIMINRYRANLIKISTTLNDAPEIVVQKMSIVIISITTCVASLVWAYLYYYFYGFRIITFGPIIYFLIVTPSLLYYFLTKKQQLLVNMQLFCIFVCPVAMQYISGGFQSGVVIDWAFLAPVGALMFKGVRQASYWMVALIIAILCTIVFNSYFSTFYYPISATAQSMFYGMNILGPAIITYFSMQFFVKSVIRDGILLQKNNVLLSNTLGELKLEKQKSDDLLLNILPEEVAEELKEKGTNTAKHFDNVTVLFTDFASFTQAAERMTPQALIDELHACFKAFDEIIGKYGIEKIKTIGDAYLAVAGLPTADSKHAENIVNAAREINAFMQERKSNVGNDTFDIRIGIHSGSAVAGIVGVKKFAYDIWGDSVNTAARMEQNCELGKINISQTTFELVKNKFNCEYRGEIDAKGKGGMKMYYVS